MDGFSYTCISPNISFDSSSQKVRVDICDKKFFVMYILKKIKNKRVHKSPCMFIILIKEWKQLWYMHTMEHYWVIERNEVLIYATNE
jgi:hypothetical protein